MLRIIHSRLVRVAALSLAATALAAPAADARPAPEAQAPQVDLRMPDTRDFANSLKPEARPTVVTLTRHAGFDWGDAAVGAGGGLATVLLLGGLVAAGSVWRTRRAPTPPRVQTTLPTVDS